MIFFSVLKTTPDRKLKCVIPIAKVNSLYEDNIQLIAWNEAQYNVSEDKLEAIKNRSELIEAVRFAASKDDVCKDISEQFCSLHGMPLLTILENKPELKDEWKKILDGVFDSWPHPMLGNIMVSNGIRPQTSLDQYTSNWESMPLKYMDNDTKQRIHTMIQNPEGAGLAKLNKSGRDQLRIYENLTDLARAVVGEMASYYTKRLEKIYALELCNSQKLLEAQKALLGALFGDLRRIFAAAFITACNYTAFGAMQYLNFFFPRLRFLDQAAQWNAFVQLINVPFDGTSGLQTEPVTGDKETERMTEEAVTMFRRLPKTICCAVLINDIRKLAKWNTLSNRYSICVHDESALTTGSKRYLACTIKPAASKEFIPELIKGRGKKIYLWNWTRDESHIATKTYRHFGMPLWAGPSGHSTGLIADYTYFLKKTSLSVQMPEETEKTEVPVASIILPSMFSFWRLYYDKRISAVHTLAETYEAALSFTPNACDRNPSPDVLQQLHEESIKLEHELLEKAENDTSGSGAGKLHYIDAFDTMRNIIPDGKAFPECGVVSSIRILGQVALQHKDKNLQEEIDELREELSKKGWDVPQWSKPLISSGEQNPDYQTVFKGLVIRSFTNLNVRVFEKPKKLRAELRMPSAFFRALYEKLCRVEGAYCLSEDFEELPTCIIGDRYASPAAFMTFFGLQTMPLEGSAFTFIGQIDTKDGFWSYVREFVDITGPQLMSCRLEETDRGIAFEGSIGLQAEYTLSAQLHFQLTGLLVRSALSGAWEHPAIVLCSRLAAGEDALELELRVPLDGTKLSVRGSYEDGKVLTLAGLLQIFGIDRRIDIGAILPDKEEVFGALGLREVMLSADSDTLTIDSIEFTITAERPWRILGDKITLQPFFEIAIQKPFDDRTREVEVSVLGKWHIGSSIFDVLCCRDGRIYAALAEGSKLCFDEIVRLFAPDVSFPPVKMTQLELETHMHRGNLRLFLATEELWIFEAAGKKLGLEELFFTLQMDGGSLVQLYVGGSLELGFLRLNVDGTYRGAGDYEFEAFAFNENRYSLKDFAGQVAELFSAAFDPDAFPEAIGNADIRQVTVSYQAAGHSLQASIGVEHLLEITDTFSIELFSFSFSAKDDEPIHFDLTGRINVCGNVLTLEWKKDAPGYVLSGDLETQGLSAEEIAGVFGIRMSGLPQFLREFAIKRLSAVYYFETKGFRVEMEASPGSIAAEYVPGLEPDWSISWKGADALRVDCMGMPLVGEILQELSPQQKEFCVEQFSVSASAKEGVRFSCMAFGTWCVVVLYEGGRQVRGVEAAADVKLVKWFALDKQFAVFTLAKAGIGIEDGRVLLLLDASLKLAPLTCSLSEAGISVNMLNPGDIVFSLSGFGVAFDNGILSIGGNFYRRTKEEYAGMLRIHCREVTLMAAASYAKGSMMAYAALSAPIGGPPAFFVTGIALGFGYNRQLRLPAIENVPDFPLVAAVNKGFDTQLLEELDGCMEERAEEHFLAAGIRFNSFRLIDGFLLMLVSFGQEFELSVLGVAELTVPPETSAHPVARAQLAIKADVMPERGYCTVEAQLAPQSYILSTDCVLSGGFAACIWFGDNAHSGDFVVTLGGYHPQFARPGHYPVVPRLGLSWKVSENLSITGEMYFALTPSVLMAGGKLKAVYTQGNLRAWFTAYADFLMAWKPFRYDIRIGAALGASYRVDWWFVHKTFSIELSAALHLWGPEIQGTMHISWFILSFTIDFSKGPDHSDSSVDWTEFKETFLSESSSYLPGQDNVARNEILTITFGQSRGTAADGTRIVDPEGLMVTLRSKIPDSGAVRPMKSARLSTETELHIMDDKGNVLDERFHTSPVKENVPAALWREEVSDSQKLRESGVVQDAVCGVKCTLRGEQPYPGLFPDNRPLSLEELYKQNTLTYPDAFCYTEGEVYTLSDKDSIQRFAAGAQSPKTIQARKCFLLRHGIKEDVDLSVLAENADDWFTEDFLIRE